MPIWFGALFGGVKWLANQIAAERLTAANAETEQLRMEADERAKALVAKRDVMIAEAGSPMNQAMRIFLGLPAGIFLWKTIVWDKVLRLGTTDNLSSDLWLTVMIVLGFYFLNETASRLFGRR